MGVGGVTLLVAACLQPRAFPCTSAGDCVLGSRAGQCVDPGYCAYPDDDCEDGLRYGPAAGEGLADRCFDRGGDASSDSTTPVSNIDCGVCNAPPDECLDAMGTCIDGECSYPPRAAGGSCGADDPCIGVGRCDGSGLCVPVDPPCDDPPSGCHEAIGSCGPDGRCTYAPREGGSPCEDGHGCTYGDQCDGAGACVPGAVCPSENACAIGSCGASQQCSYFPAIDGTACDVGACCAGSCVDLGSDPANCGGCGTACVLPQTCVEVGGVPGCA